MTEFQIKLLAPCGDCIHAPVCSIKAVIDVEKATIRIPAIEWVIPRSDSILVDCTEFIDVLNIRPPEKRRTRPARIRPARAHPPTEELPTGHGRKDLPDQEFVAYYASHSGQETAAHFGISRATVSRRVAEIQAAGGTIVRHAMGRRPQGTVVAGVGDWTPLCMPAADFAEWQAFNERTAGGRASRPCEDCPLAYAEEMRAKGMCNGEPGIAA